MTSAYFCAKSKLLSYFFHNLSIIQKIKLFKFLKGMKICVIQCNTTINHEVGLNTGYTLLKHSGVYICFDKEDVYYSYVKCFKEQVTDKLNVDEVISDFKNLVQDENVDIVLVCYEKPSDFCHRHLVANWLTENGYPCQEWTSNQ